MREDPSSSESSVVVELMEECGRWWKSAAVTTVVPPPPPPPPPPPIADCLFAVLLAEEGSRAGLPELPTLWWSLSPWPESPPLGWLLWLLSLRLMEAPPPPPPPPEGCRWCMGESDEEG